MTGMSFDIDIDPLPRTELVLDLPGVHGHEKVPTGGRVTVPTGGQMKVPASCSS